MLSDLLTLHEAAERLGVKPALLRTWRHRGVGPESIKLGVAVMYDRRVIDAFAAQQEVSRGA